MGFIKDFLFVFSATWKFKITKYFFPSLVSINIIIQNFKNFASVKYVFCILRFLTDLIWRLNLKFSIYLLQILQNRIIFFVRIYNLIEKFYYILFKVFIIIVMIFEVRYLSFLSWKTRVLNQNIKNVYLSLYSVLCFE